MMTNEFSAILTQSANYVPAELLSRWRTLSSLQDSNCRIGCIGLLKAGKSSLCNALCDSLDDSLFAVGDIRTTKEIQEHAVEGFILLDTPGLDCNVHDTQITLKLIESLDIILFVHNLNCGEFDNEEKKFFSRLMADRQKQELFLKKTVWVLSKLDDCPAENIPSLEEKISWQITALTGKAPRQIFCVGSRNYKRGMLQNKQLLIKASRIPEFKAQLRKLVADRQREVKQERHAACNLLRDEILQHLAKSRDQKEGQLGDLRKSVKKTKSAFTNRVERLKNNLQAQLDKIEMN